MSDPDEPIYPPPIQTDPEIVVTRQKGNYDERMAREREDASAHLPEIVQPGGDVVVTRQTGLQHTVGGVLQADRPAEAGVPVIVSDRPAPRPAPAAAKPAVDVVRSDDGGSDPRDASVGPQVISADKLPVIQKAPVVPVVSDQAAPKAKKAKG